MTSFLRSPDHPGHPQQPGVGARPGRDGYQDRVAHQESDRPGGGGQAQPASAQPKVGAQQAAGRHRHVFSRPHH